MARGAAACYDCYSELITSDLFKFSGGMSISSEAGLASYLLLLIFLSMPLEGDLGETYWEPSLIDECLEEGSLTEGVDLRAAEGGLAEDSSTEGGRKEPALDLTGVMGFSDGGCTSMFGLASDGCSREAATWEDSLAEGAYADCFTDGGFEEGALAEGGFSARASFAFGDFAVDGFSVGGLSDGGLAD